MNKSYPTFDEIYTASPRQIEKWFMTLPSCKGINMDEIKWAIISDTYYKGQDNAHLFYDEDQWDALDEEV